MPKRKRAAEPTLHSVLEKHQDEIFRALKAAKGFERQRLSKRLREDGASGDKKERLEREITVLKSLDLHQTARAHLFSSLLKIKTIAASDNLPDQLRAGVSKPQLPEEERASLHNVTSGLYNRDSIKQAVDRAIADVCGALHLPVPEKSKRLRKDKRTEKEGQPSDRIQSQTVEQAIPESVEEIAAEDVTDFEGFESALDDESDVDDLPSKGKSAQEPDFSQFDGLLGSSEDEEEFDAATLARFKGKETVDLDDISLSGSASDVDSEMESDGELGTESDGESDRESRSVSPSLSPPPKRSKDDSKSSAASKTRPATGSTFLPSLMGGYISGSESASDLEDTKPKKRRGQRARQAIWEKKFGASAKHLQNQSQKGGRDAGWDMRRGAMGADDHESNTPWKKGVRNPLARAGRVGRPERQDEVTKPSRPTKRDDEGPLHPSWEAKKKALASAKAVVFAGQKVVFD
ncbi:hypothetical protein RJ55_00696 [Drechmeria coniospora]|nr:hypothetical protein RJ55_00696 [Drechmeria coniospora]